MLVSSVLGNKGVPGVKAAYAASKAGVTSLGESLRAEYPSGPIKITVLEPGYIESEMTAKSKSTMLMVDNETGVKAMVDAIEKEKGRAVVPGWPWWPLVRGDEGVAAAAHQALRLDLFRLKRGVQVRSPFCMNAKPKTLTPLLICGRFGQRADRARPDRGATVSLDFAGDFYVEMARRSSARSSTTSCSSASGDGVDGPVRRGPMEYDRKHGANPRRARRSRC